jgi:hypothetical protein
MVTFLMYEIAFEHFLIFVKYVDFSILIFMTWLLQSVSFLCVTYLLHYFVFLNLF